MSPEITCPTCGQKHALFWQVPAVGKSLLKYRCDKQVIIRELSDGKKEARETSHAIVIGERGTSDTKPYEHLDIPILWTKTKSKREQAKLQTTLPI